VLQRRHLGGPPEQLVKALLAQLKDEEGRKQVLVAELEGLQAIANASSMDKARLKKDIAQRLAGSRALLERNIALWAKVGKDAKIELE